MEHVGCKYWEDAGENGSERGGSCDTCSGVREEGIDDTVMMSASSTIIVVSDDRDLGAAYKF
jgi:hypothetical protein